MKPTRVGLYFLACGAVWAQPYVISTYAGGAPPITPVAAMNAANRGG